MSRVAAPLPEDPGRVTPEWLGEALRERFPRASAVESVEPIEVHHGTNSNARLRVAYATPCDLPETFFLKLLPLDPGQRAIIRQTGMGRREALFYRTLADRVPMRVPRPYVARLDESSGAFLLLLEDLESAAVRMPEPWAGVDVAQATGAMLDFAALHVCYEDEGLRKSRASWVERMPRGSTMGPTMLQYGLDHHRDRLTDAFAEMSELYIARQSELEDVWERGDVTLLQGDSHIGNLFLDGDRVGFLDWGLVQLGPAMRDVGYFLIMALSPDNRRRHERELIARYLAAREERGGRPIPMDEAWTLYRLHAAYAAPAACPLVLFPEDEEAARKPHSAAFLDRAEQALEDLEARAALREFAGI